MPEWWENELLQVKDNKLYLEGIPAEEIARQEGTALYVYSLPQIKRKYQELVEALSPLKPLTYHIHYALKANANQPLLETLLSCGVGIDAVSSGEVKKALEVGFPAEKIFFTGTSLSSEDLRFALSIPGLYLILDAVELLPQLKALTREISSDLPLKLGFRWNPGIGQGFNAKVITAGASSPEGIPIKFGIDPQRLEEAWKQAISLGFQPRGLHQHLGSGWTGSDFPVISQAVERLVRTAQRLEEKWGPLEFLDFGGGFTPRYQADQSLFPLRDYALTIKNKIQQSGLKSKLLIFEPGKFLVAEAGLLLVKVEYIKSSFGHLFACVNAGTFNSLPRPAIYPEARHKVVNASCVHSSQPVTLTIAGNLCETGDVFAWGVKLPLPQPGDILAILHAGAYGESMASTFNLRSRPRAFYLT